MPFSFPALVPIRTPMPPEQLKPIYSSLDDDPGSVQIVHAFVIGLGERIDALQDVEAESDLGQLASLTRELIADADRAGFGEISAIALQLEAACSDGDGKAARDRLCDLTELGQRARLGHRGSF